MSDDMPEDYDIIPDPLNDSGEQRAVGSPPHSYEVGYGRPPKATQFQPGRSGNPRGRPRSPRRSNLIDAEFNRKLKVTENGRVRKITHLEAMLRSLMIKAMKGNVQTAKFLLTSREEFNKIQGVDDAELLQQETLAELTDEQLTELEQILLDGEQKAQMKRNSARR